MTPAPIAVAAAALALLVLLAATAGPAGRDAGRAAAGAPMPRHDAADRRPAPPEPQRGTASAGPAGSAPARRDGIRRRSGRPRIAWRSSRAVGTPSAGRLVRGVRLPAAGRHLVTWDPVLKRTPNRPWRRHGHDRVVRAVLRVARRYAAGHPGAARIAVGDLSRPRGGDFGRRYGPVGHVSHQNGLDVDVYFPRTDGRELAPRALAQVDRRRAQDLVDLFVRAGALRVLVGPAVGLTGPPGVVIPWPGHDDHLHARFAVR